MPKVEFRLLPWLVGFMFLLTSPPVLSDVDSSDLQEQAVTESTDPSQLEIEEELGSGEKVASAGRVVGAGPGGFVETSTTFDEGSDEGSGFPISLNYTNILFGPSLDGPSSFQPNAYGQPDINRPVFMKNFLSVAYSFNESWAITGTGYWLYRPVLGQELIMQDPFIRLSHAHLIHTDWGLNLYSDARVHFGVSNDSRNADLLTGAQGFSLLSWQIAQSRAMVGLRFSVRGNLYGPRGSGTDVELWFAPEAAYQLAPTLAATLLYEMGASHQFGDRSTFYTNDGTALEPGISWDPTPNVTINPYLVINTGGKITLASTSVGMFLTWTIL